MTDVSAAGATGILTFVSTRSGQTIGTGECYDLAHQALTSVKAKSAPDYGTITPTADYVWGTEVKLADVKPGDVIQFKNYKYEISTTNDDGSSSQSDESRPHHTAIVASVGTNGQITVWEQNVKGSRTAQQNTLYFTSGSDTSTPGQSTTITVTGTAKFYRPQMP